MKQDYTPRQIYLALLLALAAAVFSTQGVRDALANRHPRPLLDVIDELAASLETQTSAVTD
jgi:hypothetical protein